MKEIISVHAGQTELQLEVPVGKSSVLSITYPQMDT